MPLCIFHFSRRAGAGWNIGRKVHYAPSVPAAAGGQVTALGNAAGARTAPMHAASTARGGAAASSPLRMVAAEPVIQPVRCVGRSP